MRCNNIHTKHTSHTNKLINRLAHRQRYRRHSERLANNKEEQNCALHSKKKMLNVRRSEEITSPTKTYSNEIDKVEAIL